MLDFFAQFEISDWIQILSMLVSTLAVYYTYKNLREIKNQFFEQNRGNIVFYIERDRNNILYSLIIKNYGNSPAKLLSIELDPMLDLSKTMSPLPQEFNILNSKDIFLAPNKFVMSQFDFREYPDKEFNVKITYETCKKIFIEEYIINLDYSSHIIELVPDIKTTERGLKEINNSIQQLSDKFR